MTMIQKKEHPGYSGIVRWFFLQSQVKDNLVMMKDLEREKNEEQA
jgi:hypothetical protein